ncbi:MAG: hypothetical protein Q8P51_17990 [Ignavibacteria bacterium]|nr:hypothetical protein [Ignavibacteria bacterium]
MQTRFYRALRVPTSVLLLCVLALAAAPQHGATAQTDPTARSDFRSSDALFKTFYESLSFAEGKTPDWTRFRNLFASATSPCVRIVGDSVMQMDREGFISFFSGRIKQGTLKSFDEKEIGRTGEFYGSLAQVFSTYEKRMNLAAGGNPIRGINNFQLFFKNDRWWISSIAWQDESSSVPIPQKYLR